MPSRVKPLIRKKYCVKPSVWTVTCQRHYRWSVTLWRTEIKNFPSQRTVINSWCESIRQRERNVSATWTQHEEITTENNKDSEFLTSPAILSMYGWWCNEASKLSSRRRLSFAAFACELRGFTRVGSNSSKCKSPRPSQIPGSDRTTALENTHPWFTGCASARVPGHPSEISPHPVCSWVHCEISTWQWKISSYTVTRMEFQKFEFQICWGSISSRKCKNNPILTPHHRQNSSLRAW